MSACGLWNAGVKYILCKFWPDQIDEFIAATHFLAWISSIIKRIVNVTFTVCIFLLLYGSVCVWKNENWEGILESPGADVLL